MAAEKSGDAAGKILFIINHRSGTSTDESLSNLISSQARSLGFDYRIYTMQGDDEKNIRAEIDHFQPAIVAAAGGDGTVNMMAGILINTGIALLIIPYGSANGMARELNITKTDGALALLRDGIMRPIDLIDINGEICIHLADIGLNARIVKRFEKDPKRGIITYAKHLFAEMFLLKNYRFRISADGKSILRKGVSITFANASKYGTGAVINPKGILDDGKFELVIVKPFPKIRLLSIAWKMFTGKLHTSDYVEILTCKEVTLISNKRTTLQVDGEVIGKVKEIKAKILGRALKVLVPSDL
jgi:diacylglycerol kinase (ATP)